MGGAPSRPNTLDGAVCPARLLGKATYGKTGRTVRKYAVQATPVASPGPRRDAHEKFNENRHEESVMCGTALIVCAET